MKFNFRKIASIATSAIMLLSTAGIAAAANYPAPFVSGGVADGAVVYGSSAADTDKAAAIDVQGKLNLLVTGGTSSTAASSTGGDSVKLERSSDKWNLGDNAATVFVTSVTDDNLPTLLADGTYLDDLNAEFDYTQKIELGNSLNLTHFQDSDYKSDTPSLGINPSSSAYIVNYTMDFTTNPDFDAAELETTIMKLLGRDYYVLDVTNASATDYKLTLLDSASSAIVTEGEEKQVTLGSKTYTVSITYISSTAVKFNIGGQETNSLATGGTYKLTDGTYVGVKEILHNAKDTGISKAEISLGTGKLEVETTKAIELNDDSVQEIVGFVFVDSSFNLDKIVLEWKTDDEAFIAPGTELLMPGFGALKISVPNIIVPKEEVTKVEGGSDTVKLTAPIKDGTAAIDLFYTNATGELVGMGKKSTELLITGNSSTKLWYNYSAGARKFVASWNSTSEGESYWLSATMTTVSSAPRVTVKNEITGNDICKEIAIASTCNIGNIILTVTDANVTGSHKAALFTINSGGSFNRLYTKEGLVINLPWDPCNAQAGPDSAGANSLTLCNGTTTSYLNTTNAASSIFSVNGNFSSGHGPDKYWLSFGEEDKDGNLGLSLFNISIDESGTSNNPHVSDVDSAKSEYEIGDTNDYETYVQSDLGTKMVYDTGGDRDWVTITYHGGQMYGELYLAAPATVIGGGGGAGQVLVVTDAQVDSAATKNLFVVGGSCINKVAAKLLFGSDAAKCEAAWTTATTAGAGKYIIKVFASPYAASDSGKIAMLVAGYNAADTTTAVNKVLADKPATDVGTAIVGPTTA